MCAVLTHGGGTSLWTNMLFVEAFVLLYFFGALFAELLMSRDILERPSALCLPGLYFMVKFKSVSLATQ